MKMEFKKLEEKGDFFNAKWFDGKKKKKGQLFDWKKEGKEETLQLITFSLVEPCLTHTQDPTKHYSQPALVSPIRRPPPAPVTRPTVTISLSLSLTRFHVPAFGTVTETMGAVHIMPAWRRWAPAVRGSHVGRREQTTLCSFLSCGRPHPF